MEVLKAIRLFLIYLEDRVTNVRPMITGLVLLPKKLQKFFLSYYKKE